MTRSTLTWDNLENRETVKRCHNAFLPFKSVRINPDVRRCECGHKLSGYNTDARCFICQEGDEG